MARDKPRINHNPERLISARLVKALAHPTRVQILQALAQGAESANSLSRVVSAPRGDISYHVKVLYEECEVLELVGEQPIRGAREKFYRLKSRESFGSLDLSGLPIPIRYGLKGMFLRQFNEAAIAALESGRMDAAGENTFSYRAITVDMEGWARAHTAMNEAQQIVIRAETESRERLQRGQQSAVSAIFGAALFELG